MPGERYSDVLAMTPMVIGGRNVSRLAADVNGQLWISVKGAAFVRMTYEVGSFTSTPAAFTVADWRSYYQQLLGYKVGALTQNWHCPWWSDLVGQTDYANSNVTGTDTPGGDAPGTRVLNCPTGNPNIIQITCPQGFTSPMALIPDVRLKRWAIVARLKLVTAVDANTRIMVGLFVNNLTKVGIGSIGPISTSVIASVSAGGAGVFTAGTANSTKAADVNNYVWVVVYHDLTNVKGNWDNEASDFIVTPSSTLTAGQTAVPYIVHQPAAGVRSETLNLDKFALFTEL